MRAVNLLPRELRGGRGGAAPARTGSAVYVVLGMLAFAVVLVAVWAAGGRQVADRRAELSRVTAETHAAEQRAGLVDPFARFAALRAKRVQTVTSLSRSRFNWPHALREVSRVVPADVYLVGLLGTVTPDVKPEGAAAAGGETGSLRKALPSPALEILGCTSDQTAVARYMTHLRLIDGVTRVGLAGSAKAETAAPPGAAPAGGGGAGSQGPEAACGRGKGDPPAFGIVVWFERAEVSASAPGAGGTTASAPASTSGSPSSSSGSSSPSPASSTSGGSAPASTPAPGATG